MSTSIKIHNDAEARALFGRHDENLKLIERSLGVKTALRDGALNLIGPDGSVGKARRLFEELLITIRKGGAVRKHEVQYAIRAIKNNVTGDVHDIYLDRIEVSSKRQYIAPKSKVQKEYVDAIRRFDIVFGVGPAGTGKTYLAMAMAVNALKKQIVSRIIMTRPAIEAGESLGYLPGTFFDKVNPYLRPLYDALYDMMEIDRIQALIERGVIEVAPLAYMRGRTLNDAFIILDEAQNSTPEQMKMFLTRLGFDSKTVITGDLTQSDLPRGQRSGLAHVNELLRGLEGVRFVRFSEDDVVRHELVQEIIKAYRREKI